MTGTEAENARLKNLISIVAALAASYHEEHGPLGNTSGRYAHIRDLLRHDVDTCPHCHGSGR